MKLDPTISKTTSHPYLAEELVLCDDGKIPKRLLVPRELLCAQSGRVLDLFLERVWRAWLGHCARVRVGSGSQVDRLTGVLLS